MTTALIIDDHPVIHIGCRRLLQEAGFDVVLEARTCKEGYRQSSQHHPNVIVLDLRLPDTRGLSMISNLLDRTPTAKVLVFSMHEEPIFAARALEAGAHGYLTKTAKPEELTTAVNEIANGQIYLEPAVATRLAVMHSGRGENPFSKLTARELQVLSLIGRGKRHRDIADELNLSYKTVANTCSVLKSKLGAKNLPELIRIAIQAD